MQSSPAKLIQNIWIFGSGIPKETTVTWEQEQPNLYVLLLHYKCFKHIVFTQALGSKCSPPKRTPHSPTKNLKNIHVASQKEVMLKFPLILGVHGHLIIATWSSSDHPPPLRVPAQKPTAKPNSKTATAIPTIWVAGIQDGPQNPWMTFHSTGWLISVLAMAYYNPNITG